MYQNCNTMFDVPNIPVGGIVNSPIIKTNGEMMDMLFHWQMANSSADQIDIYISKITPDGIASQFKNLMNFVGTSGAVDETMMGQMIGDSFQLQAVNNSANPITSFKMLLQLKSC